MIDTIHLRLIRSDAGKNIDWNIDKITSDLDNVGTSEYKGRLSKYGKLNNMKVIVNDDYITVKGSLAKFHFGNNLRTLTNEEIVEAVEDLSIALNLPMERAYIKRLDIARNVIVSRIPKFYINNFDETKGYLRDSTKTSKLYKKYNRHVSISLYDKQKELKKNDKDFYMFHRDGYLKGKNILRVEVKIEQRLNKELKRKSVKAVLLRSPKFLQSLHDYWYHKFLELKTKKTFEFDTDNLTQKKFKEQIFQAGIEQLGEYTLHQLLDCLLTEKSITPQLKYKCKQMIDPQRKNTIKLVELDSMVEIAATMQFLYENMESDAFYNLKDLVNEKYSESKEYNQSTRYRDLLRNNFKALN